MKISVDLSVGKISFNRLIGLFTILLVLTGCTTGNVKFVSSTSSQTSPAVGEGLLIASVSNAARSGIPFNQLTITPKNINEGEEGQYLRLTSNETVTGSSTYFSAHVPAGEYSISSIRAYHSNGEYWISQVAPAETELGTFTVEAGQITDLGTLIYYTKPEGDSYFKKLARSPSVDNKFLSEAYADYIDYESSPVLGWDDDGFDEERRNAYVSMVRNPTSYNGKHRLEDGSMVFVGELGAILSLSAENEFSLDAIESDFDLNTFTSSSSHGLLLAGDFGRVFFKPSVSNEWVDVSISPKYRITTAEFGENLARIYAYSDEHAVIMERNLIAENAEWKRKLMYFPKVGWTNQAGEKLGVGGVDYEKYGYQATRVTSISTDTLNDVKYIFIGSQRISSWGILEKISSNTFKLKTDTMTVSMSEGLPKGIDAIINVGENKLAIKKAGFWSWTGKDSYFVLDEDKNWVKIGTKVRNCNRPNYTSEVDYRCTLGDEVIPGYQSFDFASLPVFLSSTEAIAIAVGKKLKKADDESSMYLRSLVKTEDRGKTWTRLSHELPQKYCSDFVPEYNRGILLSCRGISGDFYVSTDEGASWEQLREHESF